LNLAPASASARGVESCCTLLTSAYRRLSALSPTLNLHIAPPASRVGNDWTDLGELARCPRTLDTLLAAETARYASAPRPDVPASRFLHRILWSTCLLLSGPWYLERRLPLLRPEDHGLRTAAADQARPLIAALGPRLRRGPRALWGMVEDDLVSGIWHLGRASGEEEKGVATAARLLPTPVSPFPAGAAFRRLHAADGTSYPTRTRAGCCLYYTVAPGEACATCPRTGDAERLARIDAG
jgi:hypothetical protein